MKKKRICMISVMILMLVVMTGLTGCFEETSNRDSEFLSWMASDLEHHSSATTRLTNAMESDSYYSMESISESEESYIDDVSKVQCRSFTSLSSKCVIIKNEYYEYISDYSWSLFHSKWAARYLQNADYSNAIDSMDDATTYVERAQIHLNTVNNLLSNL